jgi:hypothetical protein
MFCTTVEMFVAMLPMNTMVPVVVSWPAGGLPSFTTSVHGICACLCYKERSRKLGFIGVGEMKNHVTYDKEAHVYLTLTAKVLSMFLSDVVKNGLSFTTPAVFTLKIFSSKL